jgi:phosphatidylinositol alpha-1,6-mannosyltransferase
MERTLSRSDFCIAVSRFTKNRIIKRIPVDPEKIRVLPNGVDLDRFSPDVESSELRDTLGLHPNTKVLMTLARVVERKGHDTVINALPKILAAFPNTVYMIAGPWRDWYVRDLKRLIAELGLEKHVLFTGLLSEEDLVRYYNLADVYIMVSRELEASGDTEGFGITFLEANACEKPVIGSFSGGIPDAVEDGVTGFLVDPKDTDIIANRVIQLFRDTRLAEELGRNGRRRIEESLTWERITQKLLEWMDNDAAD